MIDSIPLWFAVAVALAAIYGWLILEFRASKRYWAARDASDPVVVTASGRPSNRHVRACKTEAVR